MYIVYKYIFWEKLNLTKLFPGLEGVIGDIFVQKWYPRNTGEWPVGQCAHGHVSVRQSALFSCLGAQTSRQKWRHAAQLPGAVESDPSRAFSSRRRVCGGDGSDTSGARRGGTADRRTAGGTAGLGAKDRGTADRRASRGGTAVCWRTPTRWEGDAGGGAAEERSDPSVRGCVREESPVCRVAYGPTASRQIRQHLPSCQQEEGKQNFWDTYRITRRYPCTFRVPTSTPLDLRPRSPLLFNHIAQCHTPHAKNHLTDTLASPQTLRWIVPTSSWKVQPLKLRKTL